MNATVDADQMITPGDKSCVDSTSPTTSFATFFEDDGDTGYFCAIERAGSDITILDALQVCVVAVEPAEPRQLQIVWSRDGLKSALLVVICIRRQGWIPRSRRSDLGGSMRGWRSASQTRCFGKRRRPLPVAVFVDQSLEARIFAQRIPRGIELER
jgi:hypothetical protein